MPIRPIVTVHFNWVLIACNDRLVYEWIGILVTSVVNNGRYALATLIDIASIQIKDEMAKCCFFKVTSLHFGTRETDYKPKNPFRTINLVESWIYYSQANCFHTTFELWHLAMRLQHCIFYYLSIKIWFEISSVSTVATGFVADPHSNSVNLIADIWQHGKIGSNQMCG